MEQDTRRCPVTEKSIPGTGAQTAANQVRQEPFGKRIINPHPAAAALSHKLNALLNMYFELPIFPLQEQNAFTHQRRPIFALYCVVFHGYEDLG